jgi:hypothetical protein
VHHMSYNSGSCLPAREGSGVPGVLRLRILPPCREGSGAPCVLWLWIMPPYQEGFGAATACPTVSCGPQALNIKKRLASLPMQLGPHVLNACT